MASFDADHCFHGGSSGEDGEHGDGHCQVPEQAGENTFHSNPSLSRIIAILEDEDELKDEADLSLGMVVAYRKTACEFASILQEDSPRLDLNISLQPRSSIPPLLQVTSSNTGFQFPQMLTGSARNQFNESLRVEMPCFGPPRVLARPAYPLPNKLLDEELFKNISSAASVVAVPNDTLDTRGVRDHRKANALKPFKHALKFSRTPKGEEAYADANRLLKQCAYLMGGTDTKTVKDVLLKVKKFACPDGDGEKRMAYYFADALELRLQGTGREVYLGRMRQQRPSPSDVMKACWMYMCDNPIAKAFRYYVNQTILRLAKGASILHIMEYQFTGIQYLLLFEGLAGLPGGPPQVRLIAGSAPHYSLTSSAMDILYEKLLERGYELKKCAAHYGVPFHFIPWVGKTGDFNMSDYVNPNRDPEEVLVILSVYPLRHVNEDLLSPPEKRLRILQAVRSMNPEAFIRGFVTASYSDPYFPKRFREALYHFECQYDILDTFLKRDCPYRLIFESEVLGRAILNLVAYEEEGEVVKKAETYDQCHKSMKKVGLHQLPLNKNLKIGVERLLKSWHKNYDVSDNLDYLLMGWKGRMLHAIAVWRGSKVSEDQQ